MSSSAHTTSAFIKGFVARLTVGDDRHNESFRGESPINTLARVLGRCGWLKLPELERGKSISSHFAPKRPYHLSVAPLPGHFLNYQFKYLTVRVLESDIGLLLSLLRASHLLVSALVQLKDTLMGKSFSWVCKDNEHRGQSNRFHPTLRRWTNITSPYLIRIPSVPRLIHRVI